MNFQVECRAPGTGNLVYRVDDYSFDTVCRSEEGEASLLVNDVHLELDGEGRVLFVWGLCPYSSWGALLQYVPRSRPGRLRVLGSELQPGTSKRLNANDRWLVAADGRSGWICLGDAAVAGDAVEFAPGAVAVLVRGSLEALWLRPAVFPDAAKVLP